MDDVLLVQVADPLQDLVQEVLHFQLAEALPALEELRERVVLREVHQDVHEALVFEHVPETDDLRVAQPAVDADFGLQLQLLLLLHDLLLVDQLGREVPLGLLLGNLVHFGEAALYYG